MILEDREVEERLNSPDNLLNRVSSTTEREKSNVVVEIDRRNNNGHGPKVPEGLRSLLGAMARVSGQKEVANAFSLDQTTIGNFERGTNGAGRFNKEAKEKVDELVDKREDDAHSKALDALVSSLDGLKSRLHEIDKPEKLARVASEMSKVVNNLKPKKDESTVNNTQVILFAPPQRKEENYEYIEA